MSVKNKRHKEILDAIDGCRSTVLHAVEFELGDSPNWDCVRSRILRAFGDRGLAKQVTEIMDSNDENDLSGGRR